MILHHLHIFLSSPGDVVSERQLVREVIDRLQSERAYRDQLKLEVVAWDKPGAGTAMPVQMEPQEAIVRGLKKPSECDIVIVIFWARMGTPLTEKYRKPDGGRYRSGTEYEFHEALNGLKNRSKPDVLVYRRKTPPDVNLADPELDEKKKQLELLESFFAEFRNPDGSYQSWFKQYDEPSDLARILEEDLRDLITQYFEAIPLDEAKLPSLPEETKCREDLDEEIRQYCCKADTWHANLPVAGFVTQLRVPIEISDIYVPLHAMIDLRGICEETFADAAHAEDVLRKNEASLEIPLPEAFRQLSQRHKRGIVILGDPGSGKTTHLKRLLLWCLRNGPRSIDLPEGMLPVFLPLRELRDLDRGLDAFIQTQLDSPQLDTPKGFGKRLLRRGNLLFLLDGLDEVVDICRREQLSNWIGKALRAYPDCCFVVTSRFAGYSRRVRLSEDFLEMHIRPMSEAQVERFVNNWYRIVEVGLAKDPSQAEGLAREKAEHLLARLREPDFRARRVSELARNPLLLTNICLVHRHRGGLPKKRARLYEECIDVLLEHWRGSKGLKVVSAQTGRRALQPAALWLHGEEGRARARAEELARQIEPVLKALNWTEGSAEDFLRTMRDDSGLLIGWGPDEYGFMHLGFQEYLAAREIRSRAFENPKVLRELAGHFGESWWQEVALLLLALEDPSLFVPYMREVVRQPAFAKHSNLVELCLDDAAEISPQPFVELLATDPGKDKDLWQRQLTALQILDRIDTKLVEMIQAKLGQHPSAELRRWIRDRITQAAQEVVVAKRGGYELLRVPGGVLTMGSPESEKGRSEDEGPQHEVQVSDFYIGRYPVTNEQYALFMKQNPKVSEPEYWAERRFNQPRQPVVGVSWDEARQYATWAGLRLPSEAEWEYACRAGTRTRFYSGDSDEDLNRVGWYDGNSGEQTHPVGEKEPNAFGLYDMHGNVWEWVEDDWHSNYEGAPADGRAWVDDPRVSVGVVRGGCWYNDQFGARAAFRLKLSPDLRLNLVGFRLCCSSHISSSAAEA